MKVPVVFLVIITTTLSRNKEFQCEINRCGMRVCALF